MGFQALLQQLGLAAQPPPPPPEPAWHEALLQALVNTSIEPRAVAIKTVINLVNCFLVWAAFFMYAPRTWSRKMRASWALKALSAVHAVVVAVPAIWALFYEPAMAEITAAVRRWDAESARVPLVYSRSDTAAVFVPITLAYFIFDFLLVPVWEGNFTLPVFLHHGLSLLTWPVGLCYPACTWFLLVCLTMEASTPFVQARWFIMQHIGKNTTIYVVNGLLMMTAFFACRVVPVMPYNVWAVFVAAAHADAALPFYVRAAASCLILPNLLNLYWANLMLNGFINLFTRGKKQGKNAQAPQTGGEQPSKGARVVEESISPQHLKAA